MRPRLLQGILIICLSLLNGKIIAQENIHLAIFYKYAMKFETERPHFPLGFGSTVSRKISNKLICSAGIEYSHFFDNYQNKIIPSTYRTEEIYKESVLSLTTGLSFPIIENIITLKIGEDLVTSYFYNSLELNRYVLATDLLDIHRKNLYDYFGFGIKGKIDLEYALNNHISIFVQSGYTHYIFGEAKNKFLNATAGVIFIF
jgi:hypothetical protein